MKILFPEFYQELMIDSRLLKAMLHSYFEAKNYDVVYNRNLEQLVKKYATVINNGDNSQIICRIADKYNDLQSYLASIQNVNIPDNLRPFIMLLQDSLEMEIGSDSIPLYDALITQNKERLHDLVGINNEQNSKICEIQTTQLYNVFKLILTNESKEHIEKACLLLEPICDKFTGPQAKYITETLIHQIIDHEYIRKLEFINILKIFDCHNIEKTIINSLYSYIVDNHDVSIVPVSDTSKYPIIEVINLGYYLKYFKNILDSKNINKLKEIQKLSVYNFNNEYLRLKINFYNENIKKYGDNLLFDLDIDYINSLINYSKYEKFTYESIYLEQIKKILDKCINIQPLSEDTENIFLKGLSSNCENVVKFFLGYIKENDIFNKIDKDSIPNIINEYNERLIRGINNQDNLFAELDFYIDNFIEFLKINKEHLINGYMYNYNIEFLLNKLKTNNEITKIENIIDIFIDIDQSLIIKLLEEWCKNIFTSNNKPSLDSLLPHNLIKLITQKYLCNYEIKSLKDALKDTFEDENTEIAEINLNNYELFISNLSNKAICNEIIINHISEMYEKLDISLTNENDEQICEEYFKNIFPILLPMFCKFKNMSLDSLLQNIYNNHLSKITDKTEYFYKTLDNNWLAEDSSNIPNYSLVNILKSVKDICNKSFIAKKEKCDLKALFSSIYSILNQGLIERNYNVETIYVYCLLDIWYFDIDYAYKYLQEFLNTLCRFNYHILVLRNSHRNSKLLENLWEQLFAIDTKENITENTHKFLLSDIYRTSTFYKIWMKLINNKDNYIFYNALSQCIKTDMSSILKCREKITKTILNIFKNEQFTDDCAKFIFTYYIGNSNGTQKRSIALWVQDLVGIEAKSIINHNTCRKITDLEIQKLTEIFPANTYLTNKMKKFAKNKKRVK